MRCVRVLVRRPCARNAYLFFTSARLTKVHALVQPRGEKCGTPLPCHALSAPLHRPLDHPCGSGSPSTGLSWPHPVWTSSNHPPKVRTSRPPHHRTATKARGDTSQHGSHQVPPGTKADTAVRWFPAALANRNILGDHQDRQAGLPFIRQSYTAWTRQSSLAGK